MGGSKTAFVALHQKMIEMSRAMMVRLTSTSGAPRICAVVAKPEVRNTDSGLMLEFPGMHLIHLPYTDDIREVPMNPNGFACAALDPENDPDAKAAVLAAKKVISKVTVSHPSAFEDIANPSLQQHYENLQSKALDDDPIKVDDQLQPPAEAWQRAKADLEKFKAVVCGDGNDFCIKPGSKRKADGEGGGAAKKAVVAMDPDSLAEFMDIAAKGELFKCKVDQLKEYLRHAGLPLSGAKAVLIERIEFHVKHSPAAAVK
jgi:ATP-dependent DNA helicase 2 subunit 1